MKKIILTITAVAVASMGVIAPADAAPTKVRAHVAKVAKCAKNGSTVYRVIVRNRGKKGKQVSLLFMNEKGFTSKTSFIEGKERMVMRFRTADKAEVTVRLGDGTVLLNTRRRAAICF